MKHEKLHEEIQELRSQLTYLQGIVHTMSHQIQDLHDNLQGSYKPDKLYVHPWYKIKREMIQSSWPSGLLTGISSVW